MKLSDAKRVLGGGYTIDPDEMFEITLWDINNPTTGIPISLNVKDISFMLRQLALKTVWRKKDRIMSINKAIKDACDRRLKS